jgi:hypothetical protein
MTHLTIEQLLELREPGREPGFEAARQHLDACEVCRAEADRLSQRVARLRALPSPRMGRDQFAAIRARHVAERRRTRVRWAGLGGLALAAAAAFISLIPADAPVTDVNAPVVATNLPSADADLATIMNQSQELEAALNAYDPDSRSTDGRTAAIAARLEDQLSTLDRQLELVGAVNSRRADERSRQLQLWRERVGLLNALVDVHLTRATYAGM